MPIESAAQFDRAAKIAIRESVREAGCAYREMLRDRFLCRVFSGESDLFALKGGSSLLARIPDARATKDLDFAAREVVSAEAILAELNRLVSNDLGDFCTFRLTKSEESLDENGYSRLLRLRYASYIGDEEKDSILIDLSLDCAMSLPPERITPANRVPIEGAQVFDYLVYPLPDQLADKLCAIMERQPGGWPSSRMKDLVDVVVYATNLDFDLAQLARAIRAECSRRFIKASSSFAAPEEWRQRFAAFARRSGLPDEFVDFDVACALASEFFNPALGDGLGGNRHWSHIDRCWIA